MGCDIHLFVQYKSNSSHDWGDVSRGEFRLGQDYLLFGCLCQGVRVDVDGAIPGRGIPEDIPITASGAVFNNFYWPLHDDGEGEYVGSYSWAKLGSHEVRIIKGSEWVINPDYHHFSWITSTELLAAIQLYRQMSPNKLGDVLISSILEMMWRIELAGYQTRIVFAFDN